MTAESKEDTMIALLVVPLLDVGKVDLICRQSFLKSRIEEKCEEKVTYV